MIERTNVTTDSLHDRLNAYILNPVNTIFLRLMTKITVKACHVETHKLVAPWTCTETDSLLLQCSRNCTDRISM